MNFYFQSTFFEIFAIHAQKQMSVCIVDAMIIRLLLNIHQYRQVIVQVLVHERSKAFKKKHTYLKSISSTLIELISTTKMLNSTRTGVPLGDGGRTSVNTQK
jgi:DNA-binding transcriptional regulator WhiA